MLKKLKKITLSPATLTACATIALVAVTSSAFAITAPVAGDFAYDVYDIGVNKIVKGPIGYVGGMGAIAFGAIQATKNQVLQAVPAIIGGAAILKADAIVSTMGMLF